MVRITPSVVPDGSRVRHTSQSPVSRPVSESPRSVQIAAESLSTRLTEIFSQKSMNIPPSQVLALEAELTATGMRPSDLDADSALRALILHRNGIPLSQELLKDSFKDEATVFNRLDSLRESAGALLADTRITGENRTVLGMLIRDIDSLFKAGPVQQAARHVLEDVVTTWSRSLELQILSLVNGEPEALADILTAGLGKSMVISDEFQLLFEGMRDYPRLAGLLNELGNAAGEMISGIQSMQTGSSETRDQIIQAIAALRARISVIAAEVEGLLQGGGERAVPEGMIAGFFSEQVRVLERELLEKLTSNPMDSVIKGVWLDNGEALPVSEIVRKSGMAFEWHLLAWYRSGRDPGRLYDLLHRDVKGILTGFVKGLKTHHAGGRGKSRLNDIERDANSLLDSITRRQISTILQNRDDRSGLYFELPFGDDSGKGNARVWTEGRKKPEENTIDSENFTVSFDVDTTGLGRLYVTMNVQGKNVSLMFSMRDDRVVDLAREMETELADSLNSRGFTVGTVSFDIQKEGTGQGRSGHQKRSMDITG